MIHSQNFVKALKDWRLDVNEDVILEAFKQFEVFYKKRPEYFPKAEQSVNYEGFVKAIQGTMSLKKFNAVQNAYDRLPKNNPDKLVHIDDLRSNNDCTVISRFIHLKKPPRCY